jgi:hypothetical protein
MTEKEEVERLVREELRRRKAARAAAPPANPAEPCEESSERRPQDGTQSSGREKAQNAQRGKPQPNSVTTDFTSELKIGN